MKRLAISVGSLLCLFTTGAVAHAGTCAWNPQRAVGGYYPRGTNALPAFTPQRSNRTFRTKMKRHRPKYNAALAQWNAIAKRKRRNQPKLAAETMRTLIQSLKDKDPLIRQWAFAMLSMMMSRNLHGRKKLRGIHAQYNNDMVVKQLLSGLNSPEKSIRTSISRLVLGHWRSRFHKQLHYAIQKNLRKAVKQALASKNWLRQRRAILSYRGMRQYYLTDADIKLLRDALATPNPRVQHAAFSQLVRIAFSRKKEQHRAILLPAATKLLSHKSLPLKIAALCVLGKLSPPTSMAAQLRSLVTHKSIEVRVAALRAYNATKPTDEVAERLNLKALTSSNKDLVRLGFRALRNRKLVTKRAFQKLKPLLFDDKKQLQTVYYRLLFKIGKATPNIDKIVLSTLQTKRYFASTYYGLLKSKWPLQQLLTHTTHILNSKDSLKQAAGVLLLTNIYRSHKPKQLPLSVLRALKQALKNPDIMIQQTAAALLLNNHGDPKNTIPMIQKSLGSPYPSLRKAALAAIAKYPKHTHRFRTAIATLAQKDRIPALRRLAKQRYKEMFGTSPQPTTRAKTKRGQAPSGTWIGHTFYYIMGRQNEEVTRMTLKRNNWRWEQSSIPEAIFPQLLQRHMNIINGDPLFKKIFQMIQEGTKSRRAPPGFAKLMNQLEKHPKRMAFALALKAARKQQKWKAMSAAQRAKLIKRETLQIVARIWNSRNHTGMIVGRTAKGTFKAMGYRRLSTHEYRMQISESTYKTAAAAKAFKPELESQKATLFRSKKRYHTLLKRPSKNVFRKQELERWSQVRQRLSMTDEYVRLKQTSQPTMGMMRYIVMNSELHQRALERIGENPFTSIMPMLQAQTKRGRVEPKYKLRRLLRYPYDRHQLTKGKRETPDTIFRQFKRLPKQ